MTGLMSRLGIALFAVIALSFAAPAGAQYLLVATNSITQGHRGIRRYDAATGVFIDQLVALVPNVGIEGIAIGPDGNIYFSVYIQDRSAPDGVWRYEVATGSVTVFTEPWDFAGTLAFGPDGNLYVSSQSHGRIGRFNGQTGAYINDVPVRAFVDAYGIAISPDGILYAGGGTGIYRYDLNTNTYLGQFSSIIGLNYQCGIVFGSDGNVYVSSWGTRSVLKLDGTTGATLGTVTSIPPDTISPAPLLRYPDGDLLVGGGTNNGAVQRFSGANGAYLGHFPLDAGGMQYTYGLAFWNPAPSDSIAPTTTATVTPAPNANGWNNTDVTVTLTASDAGGSGVKQITYSATGAQVIPPTTVMSDTVSLAIATEGETVLNFYAEDNAGNVEPAKVITVRLDRVVPTITSSVSPPSPDGQNGWYVSDVTVTFTGMDSLSGIDTVTGPITLSTDGANQSVTGTATDKAGNSASTTVSGINVDKTAPSTTATATGNRPVRVTLAMTDSLSGVAATYYRADGGAPVLYTTPLAFGRAGNHTLEYWSVDNAGNEEAHKTLAFVVGAGRLRATFSALYIEAPNPDRIVADIVLTNTGTAATTVTLNLSDITLDNRPFPVSQIRTVVLQPGEGWTITVSWPRSWFVPGKKVDIAITCTYDGNPFYDKAKVTIP